MLQEIKRYYTTFGCKHPFLITLYNLILVYVLFTITRLLFYFFNMSLFPGVDTGTLLRMMVGGLLFDTSAILYTNLLYIILMLLPFTFVAGKLYQAIVKYFFILTNAVAIGANCADVFYYRFAFRRTTASVFSEFVHEENKGRFAWQFLVEYWYMFLIWLMLIGAMAWAYRRIYDYYKAKSLREHLVYAGHGLLVLVLSGVLILGGLRGGFRHSTRPITLSNAGQFVNNPNEIAVVLNTPFAIYRTLGKKPLSYAHYFEDDQELIQVYNPIHLGQDSLDFQPLNVVVIILESMGREYIGRYNTHLLDGNDYESYAPFLDSIIDHSLMFRHSFSNGRKSIDVLPAVLTSIPMIVEPYVLTPYASNKINSLGSLLAEKGYHTSFFHGAPNGSMGFQAFINICGIGQYYGMSEYGNRKDFDGFWGIWDEEFLQFYADQMERFPEPFFSGIFTTSSHHPYNLPERYKGVFPEGKHPMHACAGYTDHALKMFFEKARQMPWYDNTLFVFTADHPNRTFVDEYQTSLGAFAVPLFFFRPDGSLKGIRNEAAQHIDILPSVLAYLNYDKPFVAFGRNLFDPSSVPFSIKYLNNNYLITLGDYLLYFNGTEATALFNYKSDPLLKQDVLLQSPERVEQMTRFVKAFIQQYNRRLIDNDLVLRVEIE